MLVQTVFKTSILLNQHQLFITIQQTKQIFALIENNIC